MANVLDLRRSEDPRDAVHRAVQSLAEGNAICLPSETVYGLVASALDAEAITKLTKLVRGTELNPILAVKSLDEACDFLYEKSPLLTRLARQCWPGPVALVASCANEDSAIHRLPLEVRSRLCQPGKFVGFRVVRHAAFQNLLQYWSGPLVFQGLTSPDGAWVTTGKSAVDALAGESAIVLDDGPTRFGGACTMVRVDGNRFKILEHGVVEDNAIRQFAQPLILLVCTGNTCRSPMAETLLSQQLKQAISQGVRLSARVASAGLAAMNGEPASSQAIEAMRLRGLDLSDHQSRVADESLLASADLILTMTQNHRQAILRNWPQLADRVHSLRHDGGDVVDPIGGPLDVYKNCAEQIDRELTKWVMKLGDDWLPVEEI
jgi:protein-tyrosine phosphatase